MPNPENGDENASGVHDHDGGHDIVDSDGGSGEGTLHAEASKDASEVQVADAHNQSSEPSSNTAPQSPDEQSVDGATAAGLEPEHEPEPEPIPIEPKIELLYTPPPWSTPPHTPYYFEVREGEDVVEKVPVNIKGHYLIGRLPICDIVVDDATCSRQHAIVQFRPGDPDPQTGKRQDEVYIYDLGSTSGTYVNGMPLQAKAYYPLYKGDILQFGQYSCAFVLRDGSEPGSIPPEGSAAANQDTQGNSAIEDRPKRTFDLSAKNIDPTDSAFDEDAYKQAMIEKYMQQQRDNEEILKRRKERLAQGLPPDDGDGLPEVKPVSVSNKGKPDKKKGSKDKKKGGKEKEDCIIS